MAITHKKERDDLEKLFEGMTSAQINEVIRTKNLMEKVDVELLTQFGINPEEWGIADLKLLTASARAAVKDRRTTLKMMTYIRLAPEYKLGYDNIKVPTGTNLGQLVTAVLEAIMTGDITVERRPCTSAERREYKQQKRVVLRDRVGRELNPTNYERRPMGVEL